MGPSFANRQPTPPNESAERLANLISLGYQRTELARRSGIGRDWLSRILAGRKATADEARRIERVWRGAMALGRVTL
ncbi:hypothetical protein GOD21_12900 [Sinorhizobium medicae]|nr:hypothetical protein [Sinorhizobium medicae]